MDKPDIPFPQSPVMPTMLGAEHEIQFSCHKGIGCWNACCANIDITLTPYDIIRLKKRLGISSTQFLRDYTVPYELEKDGIAGVKFRPVEGGTACRFMQPEGCAIYEDRPTACRYYPVALLSMRKQDEYTDTQSYALVKEEHCKGHEVARRLTIAEYRKEQGVEEYDDLARGWRQLILKKKSSGPAIGTPSLKSRQLFFIACYDIDTFRDFVESESFQKLFILPQEEWQQILGDDVNLLQFAFRYLKQVLFGENTIPLNDELARERLEKVRQRQAELEKEAAEKRAQYEKMLMEEGIDPEAAGLEFDPDAEKKYCADI
ncbi:MAG: YkgJ family cysteine cluster protein [Rhodocyclaceae bacterium]|jgi:Fe-S-cluster containining protein|nr:YkgJ family cysteine cluster protein [Rhodocyclaceae bacterium]